jgi:hypothetical protein
MIDVYQNGEITSTIKFPDVVPVDTTATLEFEISNPNNFPIELEEIVNDDDDFELQNMPERLPATLTGEKPKKFTITIEFSPTPERPPFDVEQLFKVIW